jgi:hypothetical protein
VVWDHVLDENLYLDIYEGPEEDCPEDELEQHFQDWKDSMLEWAISSFTERVKEKHFHRFEECVLQAIEAEAWT